MSKVDKRPFTFARTNVMGTLSLLQAAKIAWEERPRGYEGKLFYHISTDEVYGARDDASRRTSVAVYHRGIVVDQPPCLRRGVFPLRPQIIIPTLSIFSLEGF